MNLGLINDFKYRVMKLKNILSIICLLLGLASCSGEDTMMNDVTNEIENAVNESAYVSVNVKSAVSSTKANTTGSSNDYSTLQSSISNCYLLLLNEGGDILYRASKQYQNQVANVSLEDFRILVKVNSVSKVIAVINASSDFQKELDDCISLNQLNKARETDAAYNLAIGEGKIDWKDVTGSSSTINNVPTVSVDGIVANYRVAAFALSDFSVKYYDCDPTTAVVQLENVWLTDMKSNVGLYDEGIDFNSTKENDGSVSANNNFESLRNILDMYSYAKENGYIKEFFRLNHDNATFKFIFPNTDSSKPVTAHLKFSVKRDNKEIQYFYREYVINRPTGDDFKNNVSEGKTYVHPGYWYNLGVTVHVKKDFIDCAFTCTTKDWIYNEINVDL